MSPALKKTLNEWFELGYPLFLDLYTPKSGGAGTEYLIGSLDEYCELFKCAKPGDIITIFKKTIVAKVTWDKEIDLRLREIIKEKNNWFVTSTKYPEGLTEGTASGENVEEVLIDLKDSCVEKDKDLFIGVYPILPNYWEENNNTEILIIRKT